MQTPCINALQRFYRLRFFHFLAALLAGPARIIAPEFEHCLAKMVDDVFAIEVDVFHECSTIFAVEDDRQLPLLGHVEGLVHDALVQRARLCFPAGFAGSLAGAALFLAPYCNPPVAAMLTASMEATAQAVQGREGAAGAASEPGLRLGSLATHRVPAEARHAEAPRLSSRHEVKHSVLAEGGRLAR